MKNILFLFLIVSCSIIYQSSQEEYIKGQKFRHGIIPTETFGPKDLGFQKEFTKKYTNSLRDKMNKGPAERGQMLYEKNCLSCHGSKGLGDGPDVKSKKHRPANLQKTVQEVPHFKFYMSLFHMENGTPIWKSHFTDIERAELVAFIQTFK